MDDLELLGKIVDIPDIDLKGKDREYSGWKGKVIGLSDSGNKVLVAPLKDPNNPESYVIVDGIVVAVMFLRIRIDPGYRRN